MNITRLEMVGFKSFASRSVIEFRPGITVVVGPNGCGKSNIVDAIRWVLGEQRTTALRAERMESVIFNGTAKRRPFGMAEVSLTIENNKGLLPAAFAEVAITRRLYRSGESEYLINRNPSRLRDINDLFVDTGLGHTTYSIIELPMVEGIVTGAPEVRRQLVEEAAGIAKYKARRHATENRLNSTKENLTRLEDVFGEIEKRYKTLKRQASRAESHQKLTKSLQLRLLSDLADERVDIQKTIQPIESELLSISESVESNEQSIEAMTVKISKLEAGEITIIDQLNRTQESQKSLFKRESSQSNEISLAEQQVGFLQQKLENSDNTKTEIITQIDSYRKQHQDNLDQVKIHQRNLSNLDEEFAEWTNKVEISQSNYQDFQKKLSQLRNEENAVKLKLSNFEADFQRRQDDIKRAQKREGRLKQEGTQLREYLAGEKNKIERLQDQLQGLQDEHKQTKEQANEIALELDKIIEKLNEVSNEIARVDVRRQSAAETLKLHKSKTGSAVSDNQAIRRHIGEVRSTLGENIICDKTYKTPIAAALFDILEAVDCDNLSTALNILNDNESGSTVLRIPDDDNKVEIKRADIDSKFIFAPEIIKNEGEPGKFLRQKLARTYIAEENKISEEDLDTIRDHNIQIINLKGDIFNPDLTIHGGKIDPGAIRFGWLQKQEKLEAELKELEQLFRSLSDRKTELKKQHSEKKSSLILKKIDLNKYERDLNELNRRISSLEINIESTQRKLSDIDSDIARVSRFLEKSNLPEDVADKRNILANAVKECQENVKTCLDSIRELEQDRITTTEQKALVAAERDKINDRIIETQIQADRNQKSLDKTKATLAGHEADIARSKTDLQRVSEAIKSLRSQKKLLEKEKDTLQEKIEELQEKQKEIQKQTKDSRQELSKLQSVNREQLKKRSELEGQVIGLRERIREVDRRLTEEAHVVPDSVSEETSKNAAEEINQLGFSDLSADRLRMRINSLGPVNMLALEEVKSVEDRYNFLGDQKKDLENGIEVLEETIEHINREARRKFRETFDQVNLNFQKLFRRLFDGGEARLLMEGDDPLEAKIKILATPTGKKLQALSMLSGGEKSLTAIALLFAIYEVRPSPFCILDEVDAPLDDANVKRFNKLIREFSTNTQYLIVSHNKRTMEASDNLIGVTLTSDGSSHTVAVRLEEMNEDEETLR